MVRRLTPTGLSSNTRPTHLGIQKNTVKRALASDRPPKYERAPAGSVVDAVGVPLCMSTHFVTLLRR
ncbi:hypothetical protein GCM10022206_13450 [Streptomyces chiangmaiensis]